MLVDSHCHLDYATPEERAGVIARARAAGIGTMLTISTKMGEFPALRAIAETDPDIWCTVGVHPHEAAAEQGVTVEQLVDLTRHPKVIGIGESGLDFHYNHSPRAEQENSFRVHARLARGPGVNAEGIFLLGARTVVVMEVEAAFADADHLGVAGQVDELLDGDPLLRRRLVRMNADRAPDVGIGLGDRAPRRKLAHLGRDGEHGADSGGAGARDHPGAFLRRGVIEMAMAVDEHLRPELALVGRFNPLAIGAALHQAVLELRGFRQTL